MARSSRSTRRCGRHRHGAGLLALCVLYLVSPVQTHAPAAVEGRDPRGLLDFVAQVVRVGSRGQLPDHAERCVEAAAGAPGADALLAIPRLPGTLSGPAFVVQQLNAQGPPLLDLLACLLTADRPQLHTRGLRDAAPALLRVAMTYFGASPTHLSVIDAVLGVAGRAAGRPLAADGMNALHAAFSRDRVMLGDVTANVLNPDRRAAQRPEFYRAFAASLAAGVSAEGVAAAALRAGERFAAAAQVPAAQPVDVHAADVHALATAMSAKLYARLAAHFRALDAPCAAARARGDRVPERPRSAQQPARSATGCQHTLYSVLTARDSFGRTPLHVAALNTPALFVAAARDAQEAWRGRLADALGSPAALCSAGLAIVQPPLLQADAWGLTPLHLLSAHEAAPPAAVTGRWLRDRSSSTASMAAEDVDWLAASVDEARAAARVGRLLHVAACALSSRGGAAAVKAAPGSAAANASSTSADAEVDGGAAADCLFGLSVRWSAEPAEGAPAGMLDAQCVAAAAARALHAELPPDLQAPVAASLQAWQGGPPGCDVSRFTAEDVLARWRACVGVGEDQESVTPHAQQPAGDAAANGDDFPVQTAEAGDGWPSPVWQPPVAVRTVHAAAELRALMRANADLSSAPDAAPSSHHRAPAACDLPMLDVRELRRRFLQNNTQGVGAASAKAVSEHAADVSADPASHQHHGVTEPLAHAVTEAFISRAFIPGRPLVLRGFADVLMPGLRERWRVAPFLRAHGHLRFPVTHIPYGSVFGRAGRQERLADFVLSLLYCDHGDLKLDGQRERASRQSPNELQLPQELVAELLAGNVVGVPNRSGWLRKRVSDITADSAAGAELRRELCTRRLTLDPAGSSTGVSQGQTAAEPQPQYIFDQVPMDDGSNNVPERRKRLAEQKGDSAAAVGSLGSDMALPLFLAVHLHHSATPATTDSASIATDGLTQAPRAGSSRGAAAPPPHPAWHWPHSSATTGLDTSPANQTVSVPLLSSFPRPPNRQIFVGAAGSGAPMHFHEDAVNVLLHGEKQW